MILNIGCLTDKSSQNDRNDAASQNHQKRGQSLITLQAIYEISIINNRVKYEDDTKENQQNEGPVNINCPSQHQKEAENDL